MGEYTFLEGGDLYDLRQEYEEFRNKPLSYYVFSRVMLSLGIFIKDDWGFIYVDYAQFEELVKRK